uniref:Uncharacterized protein n=1 Tax=Prolemur simus TaxID=1328070 RepID=A0A8C9AKM1_PROSS
MLSILHALLLTPQRLHYWGKNINFYFSCQKYLLPKGITYTQTFLTLKILIGVKIRSVTFAVATYDEIYNLDTLGW